MSERRTIYYIPVNYQGESRALRGLIKMRFFVEGLALAALTFLITLKPFGNLPDMPLRITVTLLVCMGPFLLGTIGKMCIRDRIWPLFSRHRNPSVRFSECWTLRENILSIYGTTIPERTTTCLLYTSYIPCPAWFERRYHRRQSAG